MKKYISLTLALTLTAACGGSSTSPSTDVEINTDPPTDITPDVDPTPDTGGDTDIRNVLTVEANGARYELSDAVAGFIAGETKFLINAAAREDRRGFGDGLVYSGTAITIAAGTDIGNQPNFSATDGNAVAAPTGAATYNGHYSVADSFDVLETAQEHGSLTLNFSLAGSTLTGTSDNSVVVVNGTANAAGAISGTVTVDGSSAALSGGFFGAGAAEVAAGFTNTDFGGYFYGAQAQ